MFLKEAGPSTAQRGRKCGVMEYEAHGFSSTRARTLVTVRDQRYNIIILTCQGTKAQGLFIRRRLLAFRLHSTSHLPLPTLHLPPPPTTIHLTRSKPPPRISFLAPLTSHLTRSQSTSHLSPPYAGLGVQTMRVPMYILLHLTCLYEPGPVCHLVKLHLSISWFPTLLQGKDEQSSSDDNA